MKFVRRPVCPRSPWSSICWIKTGIASDPAATIRAMTTVRPAPVRNSGLTSIPRFRTIRAPVFAPSSLSFNEACSSLDKEISPLVFLRTWRA